MKKAVAYLLPYIEASKDGSTSSSAGKVLMATVKGDVHDIGKNIVSVVLACNNFEIIDLGVMVPAEKIIEAAIKENVDIIGLSGLITPSLDEMVHLAKEMERAGLSIPLMIGGATTSKVHTAVKIEQNYTNGPTIHVLDASRSVTVVESLLGQRKELFVKGVKEEYAKLRDHHEKHRNAKRLLSLDEARKNRFSIEWKQDDIQIPNILGNKVLENYPLEKLVPYIDWTPFFQTWELHGKYPQILTDDIVGVEATKLFADAQEMLSKIVSENWLEARAVVGIYPANSFGDDIEIYSDDSRKEVLAIQHTLRQQTEKVQGAPSHALADFIAPKSSGLNDYVGAFVVTTGIGMDERVSAFEKNHDDYNSIMLKALGDRLAEAFAEHLHELVRKEYWGYGKEEEFNNDDLIKEKYRGIRPAPGYPSQPDHTEKVTLFNLLDVTNKIGLELTESMAMFPTAAVSGLYLAHPQSHYFALGKIDRDQVSSYAIRKGLTLSEVEKWLGPNLIYN
jgi:5-methyltetrahydrofolate--homocysteine methyltransferase